MTLLAVTTVQAADIPSRADPSRPGIGKPAAAAGGYDWSGVYIGAQIGANFDRNKARTPGGELGGPLSVFSAGGLAGGYTGYNFQMQRLVLGVEADGAGIFGGRGVSSPGTLVGVPTIDVRGGSSPKAVGALAGRIGFAMDNWLLYAKGGGAWMKGRYTVKIEDTLTGVVNTTSRSATRSGWVLGGGVEYAWSRNIVSRLEYNYMDFGAKRLNFDGVNVKIKSSAHAVKFGLAYKFGG